MMNPGDERERPTSFANAGSNRQSPYQFSPEELRVIRECNRDSFLQRCIPLGTAFGVAAYFGVNAGYLRASPKFGSTPKVVIAVIVGYFVGKFSYQQKCAEKLMQLPNSQIGEMLRQRRKGFFQETLEPGLGPGMSLAPFADMGSADKYSDLQPKNSLDMDTSRPEFDGLDDAHRPSLDNQIYEEEMPPMQKHSTSYDELRRKNREEYVQKRTSNYNRSPDVVRSQNEMQPRVEAREEAPAPPTRTNKYGDALI